MNDNEIRPEQDKQPRGSFFGKRVRLVIDEIEGRKNLGEELGLEPAAAPWTIVLSTCLSRLPRWSVGRSIPEREKITAHSKAGASGRP